MKRKVLYKRWRKVLWKEIFECILREKSKEKESTHYEKEDIMRRKILWEEKYHDKGSMYHEEEIVQREEVVREIKKYYEEICDKNGLPECNWNQTPMERLVI